MTWSLGLHFQFIKLLFNHLLSKAKKKNVSIISIMFSKNFETSYKPKASGGWKRRQINKSVEQKSSHKFQSFFLQYVKIKLAWNDDHNSSQASKITQMKFQQRALHFGQIKPGSTKLGISSRAYSRKRWILKIYHISPLLFVHILSTGWQLSIPLTCQWVDSMDCYSVQKYYILITCGQG